MQKRFLLIQDATLIRIDSIRGIEKRVDEDGYHILILTDGLNSIRIEYPDKHKRDDAFKLIHFQIEDQ